jgi:putative ABC transport system permease protein
MVAVQVTACIVLVAAAAVLGSAYRALHSLDLGYDADVVVEARPDYELLRMDVAAQWTTARAVAERLRNDPTVSGVAVWRYFTEAYPPRPEFDAVFDGAPRTIDRLARLRGAYTVEPGFFEVMGIEVLAGRPLSEVDRAGQPPVAVVTKVGADAWWPGEDPIGHRVKLGAEGTWMTVVGVVENIQPLHDQGVIIATMELQLPILFAPYAQMPSPPTGWQATLCCGISGVMVGIRPAAAAAPAAQTLTSAFTTVEPRLPVEVDRMSTMHVSQGYAGSSIVLTGRMVAAGALVALLLAALGIVGVVREAVSRRTKELGLRIALGARGHHIVASVAWESAFTALVGIAAGLGAIFLLDRTLSSVVFDFEVQRLTDGVLDPVVLMVAVVIVSLGAAGTAAATATRATRIDPVEALRSE